MFLHLIPAFEFLDPGFHHFAKSVNENFLNFFIDFIDPDVKVWIVFKIKIIHELLNFIDFCKEYFLFQFASGKKLENWGYLLYFVICIS